MSLLSQAIAIAAYLVAADAATLAARPMGSALNVRQASPGAVVPPAVLNARALDTTIAARQSSLTLPSPLAAGWTSAGCFSDSVSARSLSGAYYSVGTGMTTQSCIAYCSAQGFQIAGTEYSRECFCDNVITGSSVEAMSDCSMACTGDATQPCGGSNRLNIFTTGNPVLPNAAVTNPGPSGWASAGCYYDTPSARTLPYKIAAPNSGMSVAYCTAACGANNFAVSGVEYGSECYCGTTLGGQGPAPSGCDMPCSGNNGELCGGAGRINIYKTTAVQPAKSWVAEGCYTDTVSARSLSFHPVVSGSMTIEACQAACLFSGYSLAGVEYASECYCDNALQNSGAPAPDGNAQCDMACSGNSAEVCGGPNRLNLFSYTVDLCNPTQGCYTGAGLIRSFGISTAAQCMEACSADPTCESYQVGISGTQIAYCELLQNSVAIEWSPLSTQDGYKDYCDDFWIYTAGCTPIAGKP